MRHVRVVSLRKGGWLLTFCLGLAMAAAPATSAADEFSGIPSYYPHLQFNLTAPSAYSTAVGGYANPAVYGTLPDGECEFAWSDEENSFSNLGNWGLFLGGPHMGFGVVRDEVLLGGGRRAGVLDYRLGLAGGDQATSIGIGYGWSRGEDDAVGRKNIFQVGAVRRFDRYASVGLTGTFALEGSSEQAGLADVAIRPLGDEMLTVFADYELPRGVSAGDAPWSVGARVEPIRGLELIGRYFENESYAFSLGFNFGAGAKIAATPHFDKDNNTTNTTYAVRGGYHTRSVFEDFARKESSYLEMNLHGTLAYRQYRWFDTKSHSFQRILADIEHAKNDPSVKGIAISLSGARTNRSMGWEIREKLVEFKDAGKHIVIFGDVMTMTDYHLASVADRLVMDPEGVIYIPGYIIGRTYVSKMLEKIGIGYDEWRFFKYKSAAEALSRTNMSEADREQRYALVEDWYATVRADVSASRNVAPETFDNWVDEEVFIYSKKALELGLVDTLGRWEDVKDVIKELEGDKKRYVNRRWLAGNRAESVLYGRDPEIAVVYALGVCAMDSGIKARKLEKVFKGLREDRNVKAVVFRVDSPGGDGMASDVVTAAVKKCREKKPVIVSQGNVAASGGYWISMDATKIFATPQTITGSIGVIGGWFWNDGIGEKLGHTSDFVKVGDKADLGFGFRFLLSGPMLPERNLTKEERGRVETEIKTFYENFVEKVAAGRHKESEEIHALAQGRVYSGTDGLANGLVDEIGGLDDAIRAAREAAGIDADEPVVIAEYPKLPLFAFSRPGLPFGSLFDGLKARDEEAAEPDWFTEPEWTYLWMVARHNGRPLFMLPPEYYTQEEGPLFRK